ncbi:MAG: helicase-associated domain-containing protein [Micrococcales bacterium]|nr:helicase-associated domain-containing protein [Micrococcales bacterium]
MGSYTTWLRARDDDALARLLARRAYLVTPPPRSFASLAGRATSRSATQRALAEVDALGLQVLRAALALGHGTPGQVVDAVLGPDPDDDDRTSVDQALADLVDVGLVWSDDDALRAAPGVGLLLDPDGEHRTRATGMADGRLFASLARPPRPSGVGVDPSTAAAESVRAAAALVTMVERLVEAWAEPPQVLRRGGLGTRDLRRTAAVLGTPMHDAAFVVELAAAASLVTITIVGSASVFAPTTTADTWAAGPLAQRWAALATAWVTSPRAAWLVGAKDDHGGVRLAGHPDGSRSWLPRLKRDMLAVMAGTDGALTVEQVHEVLAWRTPLAVPPREVVVALVAEAARLGATGARALGPAGHALANGGDLAATLAADLAPAVDEVWLQADLTGVVPGRPCDALARLLRRTADEESSGGALTVRFTSELIGAAVASSSAEQIIAELAQFSRGPLPQALEYMVRDAGRRHDAQHTGARAYLRSDDGALLTRVVAARALAPCHVVRAGPTLVTASVCPADLTAALHAAGFVVGPDQVADPAPPCRTRPRPVRPSGANAVDIAAVIAGLRTDVGETTLFDAARVRDPRHDRPEDPLETVMVLREALYQVADVWVDLVDDHGRTSWHRLRPVALDTNRLRAQDLARGVDVTVAIGRIAAASHTDPSNPAGHH